MNMVLRVICIAAVAPSDGYAFPSVSVSAVRRLPSRHPLAIAAIVRTSPAQPYSGVAGGSDRVHQRSVALFGSLPGFACYALALRNVCLTPLFTPTWCVNQLVLMATSLMLAASLLPMMVKGLDARMGVRFWTVLSGAHIFASTAPAVLFAMLTPILSSTASTVLIAFSGVLITIGGLAEIYAHCLDGWWFHEGAEAADGGPNKVFSVCLVGSFAFLALATSPSVLGLLGACALPAAVAAKALAAKQPWATQKPFVYASQGVASMLTCALRSACACSRSGRCSTLCSPSQSFATASASCKRVDIAEAPWRMLGLFALRGEDKGEFEKLASGFERIFGTVERFDFPGEPIGYTEKPRSTTTAGKALNSAAASFHKTAELLDSSATAADAITPTQLVQSFVAATERGDAVAALKLVTDDFLFKTYRATTDSLAAAEARLQTKFPFPTKVRGLASSHP